MIKSFRHKGLEKFYSNNDKGRIQQEHAARLARILDRLDASMRPQDMNLPGYKLHELSGRENGTRAVWVSGNWRVTFRFDGADAVDIDYRDYH
ncbi:MAG: type II toxin-antitoxin system RelE/ParE family toxin [Candidatus Aminicenantes bacterium]|nr:type II toxin-antitoxin system RelE/ParE family toxin [Candidatus Aminicenantes bacterium]